MENRKVSREERYRRYLHDNNLEDTYDPTLGNVSLLFLYIILFFLYEIKHLTVFLIDIECSNIVTERIKRVIYNFIQEKFAKLKKSIFIHFYTKYVTGYIIYYFPCSLVNCWIVFTNKSFRKTLA